MTPTQELVLSVLIARYRMGNPFWIFSRRHKHAILGLEQDGWVRSMLGPSEDGITVWPTEQLLNQDGWVDRTYTPPREARLIAVIDGLLDAAGRRCDACLVGILDVREHADCEVTARRRAYETVQEMRNAFSPAQVG